MGEPRDTRTPARRLRVAAFGISAALFAAAIAVSTTVAQETPATLSFSPPPESIRPGEQAAYVLGIAGAKSLFGADIEVSYDPAAVAIVDADPAKEGVQVRIGPFLDAGFVVYNVADNAAGKLRVTFTQVAPKAPADGNGGLISFDLKATGGGDPKLKVTAALLARNDGSPQPVTLPSTGATPVQPQGSPAANPTEIPTASGNSPSSQAGTTTPLAQQGTTVAVKATPGEAITSAPAPDNDGDSTNWTPAWIAAGVAAVVVVAAVAGWRYKQRNGETK